MIFMDFTLRDVKLLGLISDDCYNYEKMKNGKTLGLTYKELAGMSRMHRSYIQLFIEKCRKNGLIVDTSYKIINPNLPPQKSFHFDSELIDRKIWDDILPELKESAKDTIRRFF